MRTSKGKAVVHAELKAEWFQTKLEEEIAKREKILHRHL